MSIITKTGDQGTTALRFNRRVSKSDQRVEAYGTVDELNAALGLARATAGDDFGGATLAAIQQDLVPLMGELATAKGESRRYVKRGPPVVTRRMTHRLETLARKVEAQSAPFCGWATPGGSLHSATLDLARTVCRRAERRVCALSEAGQLENAEIIVYLNRLSDLLWLLARRAEAQQNSTRQRLKSGQ